MAQIHMDLLWDTVVEDHTCIIIEVTVLQQGVVLALILEEIWLEDVHTRHLVLSRPCITLIILY